MLVLFFTEVREKEERVARERQEMEEELRMRSITDEESHEFIRQKMENERLAKIRKEEERIKRKEEASRALEAVRRLAVEDIKCKVELNKRILFPKAIKKEDELLEESQSVNQAFVYSYFELADSLADKLETIKNNNDQNKLNDRMIVPKTEIRAVYEDFLYEEKTSV